MASLAGHEIKTTQAEGWGGVENGDLLRRAAEAGYDAVITVDAGFEFQQNLSRLPVSVVLLRARSNRTQDLLALIPEALDRLKEAAPCTFLKVP